MSWGHILDGHPELAGYRLEVLYLRFDPSHAVAFDGSPEGQALRFEGDGRLVGITIVNTKQLLDGAEPIVITIPEGVTIDPATLAPVGLGLFTPAGERALPVASACRRLWPLVWVRCPHRHGDPAR